MEKKAIINVLKQRHQAFSKFVNALTIEDFEVNRQLKWSAGQELDHILKSLQPFSDILANKAFIATKFGKGNGISSDYETLVARYKSKLAEGGEAFGPFLPKKVSWDEKESLINQLNQLTAKISESLQNYTEEELNELLLPHPLLGKITIREMLYFTNYHVIHHQNNMCKNLEL
ncbi:MAG: DinB family protein [Leptolyngbya sp. SIO3F4]|nr:DinB family protein [Leptolyngbya sp. SIO3F4]